MAHDMLSVRAALFFKPMDNVANPSSTGHSGYLYLMASNLTAYLLDQRL